MITKETFLKQVKDLGLEWASLRQIHETSQRRIARNAQLETAAVDENQGYMVEVSDRGGFGYAASPDTTASGIARALEKALQLAKSSKGYGLFAFDPSQHRGKGQSRYQSAKWGMNGHSEREVWEKLIWICNQLKHSEVIMTQSVLWTIQNHQLWWDSEGNDFETNLSLVTYDFGVTAHAAGVTQNRNFAGLSAHSYQSDLFDFMALSSDQIKEILEDARALVHAAPCPDGKMDLLLSPDQMMLQIHESIGHPLELDRILGDERNYAGGSFVAPSDFGKLQYGSALLNVTFDPTLQRQFASYARDDLGNSAQKEFIIKDGLLVRGLGSLESMARSGIPGVANGRSSDWNRPPVDRMANLNIEPGKSSLQEMIEAVELGVLMKSNRSWSIDDFRNKFQFGCEYGQMIRKGKLAEVVRNPGYRGVSVPFWNSLKKVGNASTFEVYGTPFCGKAEPNQIIRVGHASPACLFSQVEVFGGNS